MRRIFHSPLLSWTIGRVFAKMSLVLPINRLRETDTLLTFYHPRPAYSFHVLIMPKKPVASLAELDPADAEFQRDLYSTVQNLVDEFHLPAYRLIVNGGDYQDFPQLHFHLVSDFQSSDV